MKPTGGQPLDISISHDLTRLNIALPWDPERRAVFSMPQFYGGMGADDGFLINQTLRWQPSEEPDCEAVCALDVPPEETGIELTGKLYLPRPGELLMRFKLRNASEHVIEEGHHTLVLQLPDGAGLDDAEGRSTFFQVDTGWICLSDLAARIDMKSLHLPIRLGSNFNGLTVVWNLIARHYADKGYTLAIGMDRMNGYAFASDHPDWGTGLLSGFRWGSAMQPGESREAWYRLYLLPGNPEAVHQRFSRDRRER